jgi:hypothetical protein
MAQINYYHQTVSLLLPQDRGMTLGSFLGTLNCKMLQEFPYVLKMI